MIKRTIKYEDFNGNPQIEDFYFNLTKAELIEMEVGYDDGFAESLKRIVATEDKKALVAEFKKIILKAYGVKSADGKTFLKNDDIRAQFESTAAYSQLFMELASDDKAAAEFINGIMPKDMVVDQDKPVLPPPTPNL